MAVVECGYVGELVSTGSRARSWSVVAHPGKRPTKTPGASLAASRTGGSNPPRLHHMRQGVAQ